MAFRKLAAVALSGLMASASLSAPAHATGDLWLEGSYEFLGLPDVQFANEFFVDGLGNGDVRKELVNDDGDFGGFRLDGGIANIPIMGGAYVMGARGFFAWHEDKTDLACTNSTLTGARFCSALPLIDNPNILEFVGGFVGNTNLFTTERDVNHWGVAVDIAQGRNGLRAGPAFRRIDQDTTITGRTINSLILPDPYQLTYSEDLDTNYWGGFVGADGMVDLGGGWSLAGDAEAGLYWADTDYSGNHVVTNATVAGAFNPNVNQSLSLESDELAFIGVLKASLEKDFGMFRLAGFGRVEYISSAPDVAYNDQDLPVGAGGSAQGPDDETRLGERFAYSVSTGVRITVPMGGGQ